MLRATDRERPHGKVIGDLKIQSEMPVPYTAEGPSVMPSQQSGHEERVARAVAGDADELSRLLEEHGPRVEFRLRIGRRWRSSLEASDVMQVTYLEAFLEIARFDPSRAASFEVWLERLAQNNLRDAIRGLSRRKRPPESRRIDAVGEGDCASRHRLLDTLSAGTHSASRGLRRDEALAALDSAIAGLPADYAAVVRAYDLQGQTIDAVAAMLDRSPGAVHMLRARAHERLAERLGSAR